MIVDLGKVEALMPMKEYPKTEKYHVGEKVLAVLYSVNDTENGGAEVILSRSAPEFVRQLMIQEVPEIADGTIVIEGTEPMTIATVDADAVTAATRGYPGYLPLRTELYAEAWRTAPSKPSGA